jgi:hypothetical protein
MGFIGMVFTVLYRFTFRRTHDGYLKVTATAIGLHDVSAIHLNVDVFAVAVSAAGVPPPQSLELVEAARAALAQVNANVCCDSVELSWDQIDILCPRSKEGRTE